MFDKENKENCCEGKHWEHHHMGWSKENKIALLEKKEKILEAKLDFLKKIKENLKKEMSEKKD